MNFSNPKKLVLLLSLFSALLFYVLVFIFFCDAKLWQLLLSGIFFFLCIYSISYVLIKKFVIDKIKGIYKNITTHKSDELFETDIQQTCRAPSDRWLSWSISSAVSRSPKIPSQPAPSLLPIRQAAQARRRLAEGGSASDRQAS